MYRVYLLAESVDRHENLTYDVDAYDVQPGPKDYTFTDGGGHTVEVVPRGMSCGSSGSLVECMTLKIEL